MVRGPFHIQEMLSVVQAKLQQIVYRFIIQFRHIMYQIARMNVDLQSSELCQISTVSSNFIL